LISPSVPALPHVPGQPLSTTLILDSEVVTPQANTAGGFAFTPTVRLADGVHSVTAQVYDQAGNQAQSGP
jgi:hypothetical protein